MRLTLVFAASLFASAIALGPINERAATALTPNLSGPPPLPKDEGPPYNPKDVGPAPNPKDDGPAPNSKNDGPPPNPKDDGPRQNSTAPSGGSLRVSILADTNRDGKVDVAGDTDTVGKETWTDDVGALFLANIVDTDRRCSSQITGACASKLGNIFDTIVPPEIDRKLSACNDALDDILRNPTYLAPLRTRPIPGLSDSATGTIRVTQELAASKVRLFYKQDTNAQWVFVTSNHTFKAQELKAGLELGIDARDIRRPGGWDGRATVEFKVNDGGQEAQDSVALRVAPVLTQHHGQAAKQLLTSQSDGEKGRNPINARFVQELGEISSSLGLESPMHTFEGCYDIWTQDFFEPGYMSIPGPDGLVSLHIMIRSAQEERTEGRKLFQDLQSDTVGVVQQLDPGESWDSTGNLETIPPYSHNKGKSYPAGRAVMGTGEMKPYMMAFLEAQETQDPIELDTSWLYIGHLDEFFQFLPANNTLGWVLMADDPLAGLEILQQTQTAGHGKEKAVSRPRSPTDPEEWYVTTTIDEVLASRDFATVQKRGAANIANNIEILKRETGLTDADIIRQPSLYFEVRNFLSPAEIWTYANSTAAGNDKRQISRRADVRDEVPNALVAGTPPSKLRQGRPVDRNGVERRRLISRPELEGFLLLPLYPATVNSVVVGKQIIAPNPWGPLIDEQDVLKAAVDAAYAKAGYSVRYIDDWFSHHKRFGEVHCGSNVIRQLPEDKWW